MLVPARTALGAAIVAANVASCAYGALVMASSRLQRCADRGADSRLDCNEELVVTLALRSGTVRARGRSTRDPVSALHAFDTSG